MLSLNQIEKNGTVDLSAIELEVLIGGGRPELIAASLALITVGIPLTLVGGVGATMILGGIGGLATAACM